MDFNEEIARLRVIARDAAITAELWLRSKHGTWRFFLVTPNSLVEIDREGKRLLQIGTDGCSEPAGNFFAFFHAGNLCKIFQEFFHGGL